MTKIELLEKQIADLDYDSFAQLREWFIEFDQAIWDKKLESDSNSGKLDFLINEALAEYQAGETIDLGSIKQNLAFGNVMNICL